jgi:hypothetical protein
MIRFTPANTFRHRHYPSGASIERAAGTIKKQKHPYFEENRQMRAFPKLSTTCSKLKHPPEFITHQPNAGQCPQALVFGFAVALSIMITAAWQIVHNIPPVAPKKQPLPFDGSIPFPYGARSRSVTQNRKGAHHDFL